MTTPSDPQAEAASERRRLIGVAYRLLGSLADAEDVVQETYARWYRMSPDEQDRIESRPAWLTTVASRVCLDQLRSARVRRESYVGEWIPEPVPEDSGWLTGRADEAADPADRVTLDESIGMAFLVVLESLTPAERVAFILHDVYRFSFAEVAGTVGRTEAACRQLASSARRRIRESAEPGRPTPQQAEVVGEFRRAWAAQDLDALLGLLDPDAVSVADGGGRATAARVPIEGADRIARYFVGLATLTPPDTVFLERTVNGQPGLVVEHRGVTVTVLAFELVAGRIKHIWVVRNPDKLRPWRRSGEPA